MNYEQKYKEALDNAKVVYKTIRKDLKPVVEQIFPELKMSEDERIRKQIISFLKEFEHDHYRCLDFSSWIAWIEEQGEQKLKLYANDNAKEMFIRALERVEEQNSKGYKLTDCDKNSWWEDFKTYTSEQNLANSAKTCKVEPKFKVGDWVVNKFGDSWHIDSFDKKNYQVSDGKGNYNYFPISKQDEMRLWTIKDAKDGDVLCVKYGNDEMPFIFTGKQDDVAYCALNSFGEFVLSMVDWLLKTSVLPATKEQRDLLFQKMKEADYEWDAMKKQLKKL